MSSKNTQIFIAKLPKEAVEDDLREMFSPFGEIKSVIIKRGYAFVVRFPLDYFDDVLTLEL